MAAKPLISVEEAEKTIAAFPAAVRGETVPIAAAQDRYLAQDVFSPIDVPEFDRSAMDGYAYISGDGSRLYKIVETIPAGAPPRIVITPGQCARIMTGAMIPVGADRVVRRECTVEEDGLMRIVSEDANLNIRRRGEDLQAGKLALARGTRLRPTQVALLASLGLAAVPVARAARVGIITTGSELAEPGARLGRAQVYDSNSYSLAAQVREIGADPLVLGRVADDEEATVAAIDSGLAACDVLILSGGASAGDYDYVPAAMKKAGLALHFEKIAVQPGMPTVFASLKDKAAFALPGNPVSTFVIFEVFIKPLLLRLMGHSFRPQLQPAILTIAYGRPRSERDAFLPVQCRHGRITLVPYHGSADLHALSQANALLRVPAGQDALPAGSTVDVRLL
jgi:molybdopterin molybdotransferase